MDVPDFKEFGHIGINWEQRCRYKYPEFFNYINNTYPTNLKFSEKIYWYLHKINDHPTCKVCGNPVKYVDGHIGYKTYCSNKCVAKDPESALKREQTNLQKYGVKNAFQSEYIKDKIKQVCIDKYGVDHAMKSEEVKNKFYQSMSKKYGAKHALQNPDIYKKSKETTLKHYGVEYCSQNKEVMEKIFNTNLQKYGTKLPLQSPKIIQKVNDKFIQNNQYIIGIENEFFICKCPHPNCNRCDEKVFKIKRSSYSNRNYQKTEICTHLVKEKQISGTTLELFIQNILDEHHIYYETNNRKILKGKELDIYIPEHKLAIECNGIYWHSLKEPSYHFDKWKECKDQGIQLLTIWEDQIHIKPEIIKNMVKCLLNINKPIKLTKKEYTIKEIDSKLLKSFLNTNHILGYLTSKIRLGLFENNQLVSVLCAGLKKSKTKELVIYRFCNKIGFNYIDSFSILYKYLLKMTQNPNMKISINLHNDIDHISTQEISSLGFQMIKHQQHKFFIQHDKINKLIRINMHKRESLCIFDSGITKFLNIT